MADYLINPPYFQYVPYLFLESRLQLLDKIIIRKLLLNLINYEVIILVHLYEMRLLIEHWLVNYRFLRISEVQ